LVDTPIADRRSTGKSAAARPDVVGNLHPSAVATFARGKYEPCGQRWETAEYMTAFPHPGAIGGTAVTDEAVSANSGPAACCRSVACPVRTRPEAMVESTLRRRKEEGFMYRVCMALALVAAIPVGARAEPIAVNLHSGTNAEYTTPIRTWGVGFDLGEVVLSGANSIATFYIDGLRAWADYSVELIVSNASGLQNLRFEVLDPLDSDDAFDPSPPEASLPAGYSTSNRFDGLSFAQASGLMRSATFAGGSVFAVADEQTHLRDMLMFSGLNGAQEARFTFGLRDRLGNRGFLVRITATGLGDTTHSPEPASMLLLGTGLAGIAGVYRRRTQTRRG
jgi:hypothetical protein